MRDGASRFWKIGDALSQLANVAFMPRHKTTNANESISGRSYRQSLAIRHVINLLFFWQDDHCKRAHEMDIERALDLIDHAGIERAEI